MTYGSLKKDDYIVSDITHQFGIHSSFEMKKYQRPITQPCVFLNRKLLKLRQAEAGPSHQDQAMMIQVFSPIFFHGKNQSF